MIGLLEILLRHIQANLKYGKESGNLCSKVKLDQHITFDSCTIG